MNAAYFRRMIDYTYWAHRQVWGCVAELSDDQFTRPCDYSVGSVQQQVVHTMGAEWLWLQRVRGEQPEPFLQAEDFPTRPAIRARWDEIEAGWRAYVAALTDDQLEQPLVYTSITGGARREQILWEGLAQIVNHATDHRAQTLALIHQVGGRTLAQDFIFYTWGYPTT
ncbi:MAG: DinB family protein [Anaerolineae bacterium]